MRRMIFMLLSIAVVSTSQAQSNLQSLPEITVSATAKVSAQPDMAEFRIGIITRNQQATSAFRTYLDRYRSLTRSLSGVVDSTKLMTDNLSVRPYYNYKKPEQTSPEYFQVQALMSLSVPISRLNKALGAVTRVDGVTVDAIQFSLADESTLEISALKLADKRAREKAEAIAGVESLTGLKLKTASTSTVPPPVMPMDRVMSVESVAPTISPGSVSVSATVHATYTAVPK